MNLTLTRYNEFIDKCTHIICAINHVTSLQGVSSVFHLPRELFQKIFSEIENNINDELLKVMLTILRFQSQPLMNHVFVIIENVKIRKEIHEYCNSKMLTSRSEYVKCHDKVYARKCLGCDRWRYQKYHEEGYDLVFYCDECEEKIGCDQDRCCDEGIDELLLDKEVKLKWMPSGKVIIMKDPSKSGYKKFGNYRNHYTRK